MEYQTDETGLLTDSAIRKILSSYFWSTITSHMGDIKQLLKAQLAVCKAAERKRIAELFKEIEKSGTGGYWTELKIMPSKWQSLKSRYLNQGADNER